jgi:hypothetical protein
MAIIAVSSRSASCWDIAPLSTNRLYTFFRIAISRRTLNTSDLIPHPQQ